MSEPSLLLLGPAIDTAESEDSLKRLQGLSLANSASYVVTTGKFDTRNLARTCNIEAGYPGEPTILQTLAAFAGTSYRTDLRFRDGYDLFCLRSALTKAGSFDYAILVRDALGLQKNWPKLLTSLGPNLFLVFGSGSMIASAPNLALDLGHPRLSTFLECALELYLTGAAYGMEDYSLDEALIIAARSAETRLAIRQHRPTAA